MAALLRVRGLSLLTEVDMHLHYQAISRIIRDSNGYVIRMMLGVFYPIENINQLTIE